MAVVPAVIPGLKKAGLEVVIESGAGARAGFPDADYEQQGARVAASRQEVFQGADVLACVNGPAAGEAGQEDLALLRRGQLLVGMLNPLVRPEGIRELARRGVTAFALELLPRITRAQSMDVLSSMATVAGYRAVLLGAGALNKMFPMMMTAAGTVTPARVFIVGAGVAGLQAIATARRLGAVVQAYDVRPAVKEQVESLGAKFVELPLETAAAEAAGGYAQAMGEEFYKRQREMMARVVAESDVVITSAAVPGKRAPVLITADMLRAMPPGGVVIDLAAESGGNCEATQPGATVEAHGVKVIGPLNIASTIPYHASQMYGRNVSAFLQNLIKKGELHLNLGDEIIRDTLVAHDGEVSSARLRELLGLEVPAPPAEERSPS